jgi:hypothetical protein
LSLPSAKKAICLLSGAQNGNVAPSVPGMICAAVDPRVRKYSDGRPDPDEAVKVIFVPSGDNDNPPA